MNILTFFLVFKVFKNQKNNHPIINDGPKMRTSLIILARLHMLYIYRSSARSNSALTCIFKSGVFCRKFTWMTCTNYRQTSILQQGNSSPKKLQRFPRILYKLAVGHATFFFLARCSGEIWLKVAPNLCQNVTERKHKICFLARH